MQTIHCLSLSFTGHCISSTCIHPLFVLVNSCDLNMLSILMETSVATTYHKTDVDVVIYANWTAERWFSPFDSAGPRSADLTSKSDRLPSQKSSISWTGQIWWVSSLAEDRVSPAWWISLAPKMGFQSEPSSLSFDRAYNWICQWQFNMIHLFTNLSSESSITLPIPQMHRVVFVACSAHCLNICVCVWVPMR